MIWNVQNKKGRQSGRKRPSSESSDEATKSVTSLQVELYGADNDKMHNYQAQLKTIPNSPSNIEWKPAVFPLFAHQEPILHALIALCLGCDVFTKGVSGLGPSNFQTKINNLTKQSLTSNNNIFETWQ